MQTSTAVTTSARRYAAPLLFACAVAIFLLFPGIDLAVAGLFFRPGDNFFLSHSGWTQLFYIWGPRLLLGGAALLLVMLIATWAKRWQHLRRPVLFLLAVLIVAPGLGATFLKDTWGRARPSQISQFGGDKTFSRAWVVTDQCERNCSFVSGHATGAFSIMALAWVFGRRRLWLAIGIAWGAHMGLVRIMQGGHFLSDVIFAGFLVYFVSQLMARLILQRAAPDPAGGATA